MQLVTIAIQPPSTTWPPQNQKKADTSPVLSASNQQEVAINKAKNTVSSRKQHEVRVDRNSHPSPPKQTVYDLDATVICREGAALGSRSKTFVATLAPTSWQTCCSTLKRDTLLPRPLSQNVRRAHVRQPDVQGTHGYAKIGRKEERCLRTLPIVQVCVTTMARWKFANNGKGVFVVSFGAVYTWRHRANYPSEGILALVKGAFTQVGRRLRGTASGRGHPPADQPKVAPCCRTLPFPPMANLDL